MAKRIKKWINPMSEFDDNNDPPKKVHKENSKTILSSKVQDRKPKQNEVLLSNVGSKNWMKAFDPVSVEDLAVHNKKIQDVEEWIKLTKNSNCSDMLLITGPVGCGKTITVLTLAKKYNIKVCEWITPLDIDMPMENGEFEYKTKQSITFLNYIINAANFTSLLDNNSNKLVLVEDFPNTFMRTPSEFTEVLQQYKHRAKSPIVFICCESHTDSKNTMANIFSPGLKEQFGIHHITFNGASATGLKLALKRASEIISKKYTTVYNIPTTDMIECVVNSSTGDIRSAIHNLHFACLKGSNQTLETSVINDTVSKSKAVKKRKQISSKFSTIGKNQTVSILHGVGRVLNPKLTIDDKGYERLTHSPEEIIEQFLSQPNSFVNFLQENYLGHFTCINHTSKAASTISDADCLMAEWSEKVCQEHGLYVAVSGLMIANKAPLSAWNPVRGPKNMKVQYPSLNEMPLLEQNYLYKGKVLVADYQTYYKIIER